MENNEFTYYAFVSYSHKDAKWAEWIQRAIEHYKLPAIIRKEVQKPLPKRIAPVFRDATDLGVDVLVDGLHAELENSRYLIVVCSPNSAKPNADGKSFVDEEVRHFCKLGRAKQIIPVIIDGTPEEAFGPVLKSQEILALDATKQTKARILNDIVAKILGLKPDVLWRRAERERKRRLVIRSILCGVLGLAATFIGLFAWDANRTVKNYYADYVDSFGLPEGIFPLKQSELKGRYIHYRFEYRGFQYGKSPHADSADWCIWNLFGFRRRLVRVVQANSSGYPQRRDHTEYFDRPPMQDFQYATGENRVNAIRYGRYNGETKEPFLEKRLEFYNEEGVVNGLEKFFSRESQLGIAYSQKSVTGMGTDDIQNAAHGDIVQYILSRDAKGRIVTLLFLNLAGTNISDGEGIFGFAYEYDTMGRCIVQWYLTNDDGKMVRCCNKIGVMGKRYTYSGRTLTKVEDIGKDGRPMTGVDGWKVSVDEFDEFDNNIVTTYYDETGVPQLCEDGYAITRNSYDGKGHLVNMSFCDTNGNPTMHRDGYASVSKEFDRYGNETRKTYFDVDGKRTCHRNGYSEIRVDYDECGNAIKLMYYGVDGKPTLLASGNAGFVSEFDVNGNEKSISYIGRDGKPVLHKLGFSGILREYDRNGNETRKEFVDVNGKLVLRGEGIAGIAKKFDARGNETEVSYIGLDGGLVSHKDGNAGFWITYDKKGRERKVMFFGVDRKPILTNQGIAGFAKEYDLSGNMIRLTFFDVMGRSACNKSGIAVAEYLYDDDGKELRRTFSSLTGRTGIMGCERAHSVVLDMDAEGNVVERRYQDMNGKLVNDRNGIARVCRTFTLGHRCVNERTLDSDGNLAPNEDGVAEMEIEYYDDGKIKQYTLSAPLGRCGVMGFDLAQRIVLELSVDGECVGRRIYDADGRLLTDVPEQRNDKP